MSARFYDLDVHRFTLVTVAAAYADGDLIVGANALGDIAADSGGVARLQSIVLLNKIATAVPLDLMFFEATAAGAGPTIASADNAAIDITDAEMLKCIGVVNVPAAAYTMLASCAVATVRGIDLPLKALKKTKNFFVVPVARGAVTFTSISDLILRLGILKP